MLLSNIHRILLAFQTLIMCNMHISGAVCIIISMSIIHLVNAETNKTVDDFQKYLDVRF